MLITFIFRQSENFFVVFYLFFFFVLAQKASARDTVSSVFLSFGIYFCSPLHNSIQLSCQLVCWVCVLFHKGIQYSVAGYR